ncbi:MAG: hypothetical protein OXH23_17495 [bacterium]|nr:hypothetical protein [bacterium]MYH71608.1 hypothetical protein [Acidimicrobiia bacterium]
MAAVSPEFEELATDLGQRIVEAGLRGLVLRFGDQTRIVGVADRMPPAATLEAPLDELLAVLLGQRTAEEMRALRWIGNPEPYIELLASS